MERIGANAQDPYEFVAQLEEISKTLSTSRGPLPANDLEFLQTCVASIWESCNQNLVGTPTRAFELLTHLTDPSHLKMQDIHLQSEKYLSFKRSMDGDQQPGTLSPLALQSRIEFAFPETSAIQSQLLSRVGSPLGGMTQQESVIDEAKAMVRNRDLSTEDLSSMETLAKSLNAPSLLDAVAQKKANPKK